MTPNLHPAAVRAARAISALPNHQWNEKHVQELALLIQKETRVAELTEALRAMRQHYGPQRPGGQAEGTLSCGHLGRIGHTHCQKCAIKAADKALAAPSPDRQEEA